MAKRDTSSWGNVLFFGCAEVRQAEVGCAEVRQAEVRWAEVRQAEVSRAEVRFTT